MLVTESTPDPLVRDLESMVKTPSAHHCQITIANRTPPTWGVMIAAAGVKFFYRDETDYTDGPRTVNLAAGESAVFMSDDETKCVRQFFAAFSVVLPNAYPQTLTERGGVAPGECLLHEIVTLGSKSAVAERDLLGPRILQLVVVRRSTR